MTGCPHLVLHLRERNMTTRTTVFLIALPLLAAVVALVLYLRIEPAIPDDSEVESITASLFNLPNGDPNVPEFLVPSQHIPEIMKKLRPAEKGEYLTWRENGQLTIRRKDGRTTTIRFLWPAKGPLHFTVDGIQHIRANAIEETLGPGAKAKP